MSLRASSLLVTSVLLACGADGAPSFEEPTSSASVIAGESDAENTATVLVQSAFSRCSGVLVARQGATGFVLTAAHCKDPTRVFVTSSRQACDEAAPSCVELAVDRFARNPSWIDGARGNDVMVIQVSGLAGTEAVVPMGEPDGFGVGTPIELSGFGLSNDANGELVDLGERRRAFTEVATVTPNGWPEGLAFAWHQSFDGPLGGGCSGDSGGPLYVGSGADKRVAGIFSSAYCDKDGLAARLSHSTPFVEAFIAGAPLPAPEESCDTCIASHLGDGSCDTQLDACGDDQACLDADSCYEVCDDDTCRAECLSASPSYVALATCLEAGCDAVCSGQAPGSGGGGGYGGAGAGAGGGGGTGSGDGPVRAEGEGDGCSTSARRAPSGLGLLLGCALLLARRPRGQRGPRKYSSSSAKS